MPSRPVPARARVGWTLALIALAALRLPSFAQPAAADQSLYAYAGQQLLSGHAPYAAAWDQKPPGIHVVYAVLWAMWSDDAVVAAADTAAAMGVAALLVLLSRQFAMPHAGALAAAIFLLFGHPSIQRLGGVFVRGQCETFIGLCVTLALVLAALPPRRARSVAAGVCIGLAVWLKYNAIVYAAPMALCLFVSSHGRGGRLHGHLFAAAAGLLAVGLIGLATLGAAGALHDLRLATFDFNVQYSGDTYNGPWSVVQHLVRIPLRHARFDLLWFLGGVGLVLSLISAATRRAGVVALAWTGAAVVSIALNGARDLPQYFVQAWPALGWAAGVGLVGAWQSRHALLRTVVVLVLLAGLWRVGIDDPVAGMRLGGVPQLVENIRFDLAYLRGIIDRTTYLDRFGGQRDQDKFVARDVDELAALVRSTTSTDDTILVFGFSPGIYVKGARTSASRFFWSRPVVIGFADDHPGYGVDAFLVDLEQARPALVILQKQDWGPAEPNSEAFFLSTPALAEWLRRGYRPERQQRLYSIWRRVD